MLNSKSFIKTMKAQAVPIHSTGETNARRWKKIKTPTPLVRATTGPKHKAPKKTSKNSTTHRHNKKIQNK
jgi:hypothetical protein